MVFRGAHIRTANVLGEFCSDLTLFSSNMQANLISINQEIIRTQEWLIEREKYWQREIENRRAQVREAIAALAVCEMMAIASGGKISCECERDMIAQAKNMLREAEENLNKVKQWKRRLDFVFTSYYSQAQKLNCLTTNTTDQAKSFLRQKQNQIEKYNSIPLGLKLSIIGIVIDNNFKTIRNSAVKLAGSQEIELVRNTNRGTSSWSDAQLKYIAQKGILPKGFVGHHINNVKRFPELAGNPDNIRFVSQKQHFKLHNLDWHNNTSGKIYNRKSLIKQWVK